MFGRETTDYFIRANEDYHLEGYSSSLEVIERAENRLKALSSINQNTINEQGIKEYNYQLGIEKFIISFFKIRKLLVIVFHIFVGINLTKK